MFGAAFGLFLFTLPLILIVTVIVFVIYKRCFDRHTNRVLENAETGKRKWMAPWGVALIVLGAQLILVTGIMFPLSMYMMDTSSKTVVEEEKSAEFGYDFSLDTAYVAGDDYQKVSEGSGDGISCSVFKRDNGDGSVNLFVSGSITPWNSGDNLQLSCVDENGEIYSMASYFGVADQLDTLYFKMEMPLDEYHPGTITVILGSNSSSEEKGNIELSF